MKKEITYKKYLKALKIAENYVKQEANKVNKLHGTSLIVSGPNPPSFYDFKISSRLITALSSYSRAYGIEINEDSEVTVLREVSKSKFLKIRNVGCKTMDELDDICKNTGVRMKS